MQFSDEFLSKWECLIGDVDKTEIPLECLKKVILKLEGRRQRTINLHSLRKQGLDGGDRVVSECSALLLRHSKPRSWTMRVGTNS